MLIVGTPKVVIVTVGKSEDSEYDISEPTSHCDNHYGTLASPG